MINPSMMGGPPPDMGGGMPPPPGLPPEGPPAGPPPDQGPPVPEGMVEGVTQILRQILDLADQYRSQEEDDQNLLLVEQLRTIAQKILANEQKMSDDLMQGKATPQALRRYAG